MKIKVGYVHGDVHSLDVAPEVDQVGVFSRYKKEGGKFRVVSDNVVNTGCAYRMVTPDRGEDGRLARSVLVSPDDVESPIEKALLEGADPVEVSKFYGVEIESIHYDRAGTDFETNQPIYRTRGLNFAPPHRPNMCYSQLTRKLQCAERDHETAVLMYPEIVGGPQKAQNS